ncbi:MAG TPA: hypothetical protein VKR43_02720 [Bryobacteraceae bacterium]|nr:hypothetical protein [Bryobacteraceae bacterium]
MATNLSSARQAAPALPRVPMIVVGAVIVFGSILFYYLQVSKQPDPNFPLTPEAKVYVRNLQLSDVTMKASESYFKQVVVEIEGKIGNGGDRNLTEVDIYCIFYDSYGQVVLRKRVPIVGQRMGGLKPGDGKSFRLPFDEIPESWNHAMPQLVIAGIKFS